MAQGVHTSDANRGDVLIGLTHPRGPEGAHVRLSIRDQRSGQILINVDLTAEEFVSVMSGTGTRVSGATLPAFPERLGLRMQNTSASVRAVSGSDVDREAKVAEVAFLADGWDVVRIDRTNFGRRVVAYRWIADEEG